MYKIHKITYKSQHGVHPNIIHLVKALSCEISPDARYTDTIGSSKSNQPQPCFFFLMPVIRDIHKCGMDRTVSLGGYKFCIVSSARISVYLVSDSDNGLAIKTFFTLQFNGDINKNENS